MPAVDSCGCRVVQFGRNFQAQWFDTLLADPASRQSVSRHACEISWGGHGVAGLAAPVLRTLGSNLVIVDDMVVRKDQSATIRPGSNIRFMLQQGDGEVGVALALVVRCTGGVLGTPTPSRRPKSATPTPCKEALARPARSYLPPPVSAGEHWKLECVYAAGLPCGPKATAKSFCFTLAAGTPAVSMGRQHQMAMFEALLVNRKDLLAFISRNHLQFEPEAGGMRVTNVSQNIVITKGSNMLHRGEAARVGVHDTVSFAAQVELMRVDDAERARREAQVAEDVIDSRGERDRVAIAPFLTFRLLPATAQELAAGASPPASLRSSRQAPDRLAAAEP